MSNLTLGAREHSPTLRDQVLRALRDELRDRIQEVGLDKAVRTLRADVRDGLAPGATLADVAAIATAYGEVQRTNTQKGGNHEREREDGAASHTGPCQDTGRNSWRGAGPD